MPPHRRLLSAAALAALFALAFASEAFAWGSTGHRLIGQLAIAALPSDLPAFLRNEGAKLAVGELAREPDRWKDAGRTHDSDLDPGHFLDLGDDGKVFGGPELAHLPDTRGAYDAALRAAGVDGWKAGYLPYSIVEGWQQLVKDLAVWRMDRAGAAHSPDPAHRAWMRQDMAAREALVLRDAGVLGHFVGDGSQPLHVTVHFNGWGDYPNPLGFTQAHVHGPFEGEFVRDHVDPAAVRAAMSPYRDCRCEIRQWTSDYLAATAQTVVPFYELDKAGGFARADDPARAFTAQRLAAGASALRDVIVDAWRASAASRAGWPTLSVADVEAGRVDPFDSLYGVD
jgi:hypothetical protein